MNRLNLKFLQLFLISSSFNDLNLAMDMHITYDNTFKPLVTASDQTY